MVVVTKVAMVMFKGLLVVGHMRGSGGGMRTGNGGGDGDW